MGGCAPYCSLAGMFRSSTKMTHFFPTGGPKTPLRRLSNLDMTRSWGRSGEEGREEGRMRKEVRRGRKGGKKKVEEAREMGWGVNVVNVAACWWYPTPQSPVSVLPSSVQRS